MKNINKKSYFILRLNKEDYAYTEPIPKFSLCGGNDFTLSIAFYPPKDFKTASLFKQSGTFDIGYKDDHVYYKAEGMGEINTDDKMKCIPSLNILDITYDQKKLSFYMNGILGYEKEIVSSSFINNNHYIIGEDFTGDISYVKGLDICLDKEKILKNLFKHSIALDNTIFYYDFTNYRAIDRGKYKRNILITGTSEIKNIVSSLAFSNVGNGGVAIPKNCEKVNPGGFESNEFSVLSKIFLLPTLNKQSIIMVNGSEGEKGLLIAIEKDQTSDEYSLFIEWGDTLNSITKIELYTWVDVAITYKNKVLKIFIDGVKDSEKSITTLPTSLKQGKIAIGNKYDRTPLSTTSFSGYIDYVSIFDKELTANELDTFMENPPFIYEDNIIALYSFENQTPLESITCNAIDLFGKASVKLVENTVFEDTIEEIKINYGISRRAYSNYETWQANTLGTVVLSYMSEISGLAPTSGVIKDGGFSGKITDILMDEISSNQEISDFLFTVDKASPEKIKSVIDALNKKGTMSNLSKSFFSKISFSATIGVSALAKVYASSNLPLYIAGGLLVLTIVATLTKEKTEDPPIPFPPTPKPEQKYRYVSIKSITFNHSNNPKESSVNVRNASNVISAPEWVEKQTEPSVSAYIKSQVEVPYLTVELNYQTNYSDSITGQLTAKAETLLSEITPTSVTFNSSGTYSVKVYFSKNSIKSKAIGKYSEKLMWSFSLKGPIGTSLHTIYTIADLPIAPWDIYKKEKCPTLGSLNMLSDIISKNPITIESLEEIAKATTKTIQASNKFKFSSDNKAVYSSIPKYSNKPQFDGDRFESDYNKTSINVNGLDCALIINNICTLNGYKINIIGIKSNLEPFYYNKTLYEQPLFFSEIKLLGKTNYEDNLKICEHFFAATGTSMETAYVYDPSLCSKEMDVIVNKKFTGINNQSSGEKNKEYYRESLFREGTSCTFSLICKDWEREKVTNLKEEDFVYSLQGIVIGSTTSITLNQARDPFDNLIITFLRVNEGQARCHSISYHCISNAIIAPINACLNKTITPTQMKSYLNGLHSAVFIKSMPINYQCYIRSSQDSINSLFRHISEQTIKIEFIVIEANNLLSALNNSHANLRIGNSSWNSSVQSAFDPGEWYFVYGGVVLSSHYSLSYSTPPSLPVGCPAQIGDGFYLTSYYDGDRLDKLIHSTYTTESVFLYTSKTESNEYLISSSSNQFALDSFLPAPNCAIYYLVNSAWVKF